MKPDRDDRSLLFIAERFPPDLGGVARSAFRVSAAIRRLGWNVHVLAWTKTLPPGTLDSMPMEDPDASRGEAQQSVVTLHRLGLFSNWDFSLQHTSNVLEWLHEKFEFSATWGHYVFPAGYMAVVFAESMRIASTVSARGNDVDRLMFPPGDFARLMWTLDRATAVSCVSLDLSQKIDMLLGRSANAVVLPNVVDTRVFCADSADDRTMLCNDLGILPEEAVLGFCGELRHKKGLPFLLAALVEVRQTRPACLLVIGEVRPREQAHLAAFAAEHPEAAARIIITDHIEDHAEVARHFRICDVILQPSVWDGMPNAILEAMACERIVLASDAGGIPEAIEDRVSGFLIRKSLLHRLGGAIAEVLELPETERVAVQAAARRRVLDCFHARAESARLEQLLSRLSSDAQS